MMQVAVVSFVAAFTLGSGALHFLLSAISPPAVAEDKTTTASEITSPLVNTIVLGETDIVPSPTPDTHPDPTPTSKPKTTPQSSPPPTLVAAPVTGAQLDEWFTTYANHESINRDLLRNLAYCESKFNQYAKNGDYLGLYQFSSGLWVTTRRSMNQNPDPKLRTNAEEAIKTAAFRIATVGHAAWPNCSK